MNTHTRSLSHFTISSLHSTSCLQVNNVIREKQLLMSFDCGYIARALGSFQVRESTRPPRLPPSSPRVGRTIRSPTLYDGNRLRVPPLLDHDISQSTLTVEHRGTNASFSVGAPSGPMVVGCKPAAPLSPRGRSLPSLVVRIAISQSRYAMQDDHYLYLLMDHLQRGELFSLLVEVNTLPLV